MPPDRIVLCRPGLPGWIGQPSARPEPRPGYVLFVGTLEPRKNIGTLLDAWTLLVKRVPSLPKLRLVGAARPEAGTWLARLQVPPLAGTVEYVGYIPDASRRDVYAGARLLVLPSWHEGFGLPALEAMALGVPVVVSNRGALPEVVGDAGLLVAPDDARGLAAAIESVLRDPPKASAMSARGLVQAAGFTWDAAAHAAARRLRPTAAGAGERVMRIGVDARELSGHATGVGRYLQCLLREWGAVGRPHQWTLYSPDGRLAVPPGLTPKSPSCPARQHPLGAGRAGAGRPTRPARRLLRARLHGAADHRRAAGGRDARRLVCGAPRVVSLARRPAAPMAGADGRRGRRARWSRSPSSHAARSCDIWASRPTACA